MGTGRYFSLGLRLMIKMSGHIGFIFILFYCMSVLPLEVCQVHMPCATETRRGRWIAQSWS